MLQIFSFFLLVLVGLELVEVIKDYLHDDTVHVEVVLLVALIAVARKVIVLDPKALDPAVPLRASRPAGNPSLRLGFPAALLGAAG